MIHLKRIIIKTRAQFVWIRGVLMWGCPTGISSLLFGYFFFGKASGEAPTLTNIIIHLIVFLIAGYFLGIWTWKIAQKKEKKHDIGKNNENL